MSKVPKIISLQYLCYLKKEMRDKHDFLHEDKHQCFLQAGSIDITGHNQGCPKYPKQQVCKNCTICQKRREV